MRYVPTWNNCIAFIKAGEGSGPPQPCMIMTYQSCLMSEDVMSTHRSEMMQVKLETDCGGGEKSSSCEVGVGNVFGTEDSFLRNMWV